MKKILIATAAVLVSLAAFAGVPQSAKDKAASLVSKMTLEEKVQLISGVDDGFHTAAIKRLGIPSVRMADGPQGVRNKTNSTYYPCGVSVAASFSRDAAKGVGEGIGFDAKARGVGIMLCPGVNIYRTALCGRNFEYYGEDPYLASEQAASYISGIQSKGVMATVKHFALNNQEYDRHWTSSYADARTMNEIYFPTFRKAVEKADVACLMTSYNPVNGIHAAENDIIIKDNLRKWGFEGIVMSDWSSTYTTYGCLTSGLDLEMPKAYALTLDAIKPLLDGGMVSESEIDEKCQHILQLFIQYGFLDGEVKDASIPEDYELSRQLAYQAAVQGPVLLENNGILPIKPSKKNKIVIAGPNADYVAFGGGSGRMDPFPERNVTFWQAMSQADPKKYAVSLATKDGVTDYEAMKGATAVILAVGYNYKTETENSDRTYSLPEGQNEMILKAAEANSNVIVIVNSGGEVDINPWKDKVAAIIFAWYGGQEGGKALADIVTGKVSPSGRLPFTFWGTLEKNPVYAHYPKQVPVMVQQKKSKRDPLPYSEYAEGIFVGYRGVSHFGVQPMYPFGYGLTYSSFEYSALSVAPASDGGADVSVSVKNTGKSAASEVVQVYVAAEGSKVARPQRELKGYAKLALAAGETKVASIHLDADAFKYYDTKSASWVKDSASFKIQVGKSSEEIILSASL